MIYDDNLFTPTPESSEWSKPIISRLAVTLFQYQQITKTDDDDSHQRIQISLISLAVKIYTFSVSLYNFSLCPPQIDVSRINQWPGETCHDVLSMAGKM